MLKKFIAVSLVAAMALPVTGAFASDNPTDRVTPNIQNTLDSNITVAPGKDEVSILAYTWTVKTTANIRATASPTGAHVLTVYAGTQLFGQHGGEVKVVNGEKWVYVWNSANVAGWILLSALEETG
ncbi:MULTISPECIES: hypothetical protein [Paenibacillus]|uniref:hypothetical protein n=1 Tax=Paenibacillus TaxID=44249 RepID=UPI0009A80AC5|nr:MULTISPECIES: hypothetical protein [Paenibacillus]MCZ1268255.1 hypothetical protein [Paenibacillus tundrae]SLK15807.1 hypothetical protein SAMN06272722_11014 [Paenibacillus sp. RU5A]SOC74084.1 hypothetical protein SAMN05880581_11014 [Paenibacillus sp. RU26A]SOC76257.1 hypothetical protein SAMN05880586_11014 [Paenibacillus sp. RU5M]